MIPTGAWQGREARTALHCRDVSALLRFAQKHTGVSQVRLGAATGLGQGRVNEIINGKREVTKLEVFERIAEGLNMPDDARMLLGLAPRRVHQSGGHRVAGAEITAVFPSQAEAADEIRRRAASAHRVDLLAARALGLVALNDSLLRRPLAERRSEPVRVRALLLDPDSPAAARRAAEVGQSTTSFIAGLQLALDLLAELAALPGIELSLAVYQSLPNWRMIALDGTLYLSGFGTGCEGHRSGVYRLTPVPNGVLHAGFVRQFEDLWATARPVRRQNDDDRG